MCPLHHPDKGGNDTRASEINIAWEAAQISLQIQQKKEAIRLLQAGARPPMLPAAHAPSDTVEAEEERRMRDKAEISAAMERMLAEQEAEEAKRRQQDEADTMAREDVDLCLAGFLPCVKRIKNVYFPRGG